MASGQTPEPMFQRGDTLAYGVAAGANRQAQEIPDYKPADAAEQFLFSPTDKPHEPLTHGAPFGPGAPVTPYAVQSDQSVVQQVADQALADPNAPTELRQFARRVLGGM